jgi:hypothetical protein
MGVNLLEDVTPVKVAVDAEAGGRSRVAGPEHGIGDRHSCGACVAQLTVGLKLTGANRMRFFLMAVALVVLWASPR